MVRIYLATSWKNQQYEAMLALLREHQHDVYDFRKPGMHWSDVNSKPRDQWSFSDFYVALQHHIAHTQYRLDKDALDWCQVLICMLPCGKSAHLEAGYAIGQNKHVYFMVPRFGVEPELMYLLAGRVNILCDSHELIARLASHDRR